MLQSLWKWIYYTNHNEYGIGIEIILLVAEFAKIGLTYDWQWILFTNSNDS